MSWSMERTHEAAVDPAEVLHEGVRGQCSRMLVEETRRVAELAGNSPAAPVARHKAAHA